MKVYVTKRGQGTFDVRVKRTRRSEGDNVSEKGLTRAELKAWLPAHLEEMAHPKLPAVPTS